MDRLLTELADRRVLRPDGPITDTIRAERAVTTRDLLTFTWGFEATQGRRRTDTNQQCAPAISEHFLFEHRG